MKILKKICPICALVSLIWLAMLIGKWLGYNVNDDLLAMLMGGSAVGISYVLANRLENRVMAWKFISIPIALAAMYALLHFAWGYFLLAMIGYLIVWAGFRGAEAGVVRVGGGEVDIKKELNNCC